MQFANLGMENTDRPGTTGHDAAFRPPTRSAGRAGEQASVGSRDVEYGGKELERSDKAEADDRAGMFHDLYAFEYID